MKEWTFGDWRKLGEGSQKVFIEGIRAASVLLSPAGSRARLTVFVFHRVLKCPTPYEPHAPDVESFDRSLQWISSQFCVLPLEEAMVRLYAGTLPACAAALSFDDGYRDNYEFAVPILLRHGVPATFFIATGFMAGGAMFHDRIRHAFESTALNAADLSWAGLGLEKFEGIESRLSLIGRLTLLVKYKDLEQREAFLKRVEEMLGVEQAPAAMMTPEEIRAIARAGMTIGVHTRNHPILAFVNDGVAWQEVYGARCDIADICSSWPTLFAYPNGQPGKDFDDRHVRMVAQAGYKFGFSSQIGPVTKRSNRFVAPRLAVWPGGRLRFHFRMLRNMTRA